MQKLQLSIPEPCHENWQQMTPTNQGRFCNACAKEVVDFSMMTDIQVLNYFSTITHEKVCGRALPEQLDRAISRPEEPKKRLFWYWNYIVIFFMFFAKGNTAKAQGSIKQVTECTPVNGDEISKLPGGKIGEVKNMNQVITGKTTNVTKADTTKTPGFHVTSINNDVFNSDARIRLGGITSTNLTNNPLLIVDGISTSLNQLSSINPMDIEDVTILKGATAAGIYGPDARHGVIIVTTKKLKIKNLDTVSVTAYITTRRGSVMMGGMISGVTVEKRFTDTLKMVATKINGAIKIYPNPAKRGEQFNISLKLKQAGLFQIQITDATGRIVLQKQFIALAKEHAEKLVAANSWSAGMYYISIIDKNNKLISRKNFMLK